MHRYDLATRSWLDVSSETIAGALPSERMGPGLAACDQTLYLYGGSNKTGDHLVTKQASEFKLGPQFHSQSPPPRPPARTNSLPR